MMYWLFSHIFPLSSEPAATPSSGTPSNSGSLGTTFFMTRGNLSQWVSWRSATAFTLSLRHSAQLGAMEGITSPDIQKAHSQHILSTFSGRRKIMQNPHFQILPTWTYLDPPFVSASPHSQYSHKIELRIAAFSRFRAIWKWHNMIKLRCPSIILVKLLHDPAAYSGL